MANRFIEGAKSIINGIRVKPNNGNIDDAGFAASDDIVEFLRSLDDDKIMEIVGINNFRDISGNRAEQYDAFDEMERDASISAALKMYADDATQYNLDGDIIWVEASDSNIAAFGNRLLKVLRVNEHSWSHVYNLIKYGDIYLETFYDDEVDAQSLISTNVKGMYGAVAQSHRIGARIEEYIEMAPNPAVIFDLKKRGKTEGFIKIDDDEQNTNNQRVYSVNLTGTNQRILPADKYIHIMLSEVSDRFPETFDITFSADDDSNTLSEPRTYRYTVAKGKSILFDVFKAYRELKLMEDSILLNRVTRSAITRILQIEVGDMPKNQVKEKLRQIKMMIEQKNFMDKNSGTFASQASPGPVDNVIYVPTRNGNGAITMSSLGGDVDPKSLLDIEYFQQKEAGVLGVPLAYISGHCFRGNTKIRLLDNTVVTIQDMFTNSDKYIGKGILSCDSQGNIHPSTISNIQLTRKNARFVRITLDSGEYVDVTPDHRMMRRDGSFEEAQNLKIGDSLMPCYRKTCQWKDEQYRGRIQVYDNASNSWQWQYQLVGRSSSQYVEGMQIHHEDRNIKNDDPSNLTCLHAKQHLKEHLEEAVKASIPAKKAYMDSLTEEEKQDLYYRMGSASRGKKFTESHKQKISEALTGRVFSPEHKEKLRNSLIQKAAEPEYHKFLVEISQKGVEVVKQQAEERKNLAGIHERTVKCFKCGKVFRQYLSEEEYSRYLNKEFFVYCCPQHLNNRLNMCMNLLIQCNYDYDMYENSRKSGYMELVPKGKTQQYCSNKYFSTKYMKDLIENRLPEYEPQVINHRVAKIEYLDVIEDAYDVTVTSDSHTFALDCGIFVHNSGDGGGLSSGTALTKLDNKYARAVKRIQNAYIQGITNLINVFAIRKGLPDYVNNFTVKMVSPSTIEDDDRDQQLDNRISMMTNLIDFLRGLEIYDDETIKEITEYLTSVFLNRPEVSKILEEDDFLEQQKQEEQAEMDMEDNDFGNFTPGPTNFDSEPNDFGGFEDEPADDFEDIDLPDIEPETSETSDFGDFEQFA